MDGPPPNLRLCQCKEMRGAPAGLVTLLFIVLQCVSRCGAEGRVRTDVRSDTLATDFSHALDVFLFLPGPKTSSHTGWSFVCSTFKT
jgi:hypothetical protein